MPTIKPRIRLWHPVYPPEAIKAASKWLGPHPVSLTKTTRYPSPQRRAEAAIAEVYGIPAHRVLVTNSCTAALHTLSSLLYYYRVRAPAMTWPSSYSWASLGDHPVELADEESVLPTEGKLDTLYVEVALWGWQPRTPVIPEKFYPHSVIIDAAQFFGTPLVSTLVDSPWCAGVCHSFFDTKQVTCHRGGCIISSLFDNPTQRRCAEAFIDSGTVDRQVFRSSGLNYEMPEFNAALLCEQLKRFPKTDAALRRVVDLYHEAKNRYFKNEPFRIVSGPNGHIMVVEFEDVTQCTRAARALYDARVQAGVHYPIFKWACDSTPLSRCNKAIELSTRILTLPCHTRVKRTAPFFILREIAKSLKG